MTPSRKSDSIQGLEQFCAKLKGKPLSALERANLRELLRQAVYDEWRLTYDAGDGAGGVVREAFGLDENGARRALGRYRENPHITELRLWRRPKPAKWESAE